MKRIGPHSRPGKLAIVDGRSAEARRMKEIRADLEAQIGENISTAQRMMIERIAVLMLRMELMDRQSLKDAEFSEKNAREYLAWTNSCARMLKMLGLQGKPAKAKTLRDHLQERAA